MDRGAWKAAFTFHFHALEKVKLLSRVRLFATPWAVADQAPRSMKFSRQEYWSGLPFPSAEDLPTPGIEAGSPALQADALLSEPPGKPKEMAAHSSVLAWRIPGTGEPGGLPSMGSRRVEHDWSDLAAAADPEWTCRAPTTWTPGMVLLEPLAIWGKMYFSRSNCTLGYLCYSNFALIMINIFPKQTWKYKFGGFH